MQQFEDRLGVRRVGCWQPGPPAIPRRRSMAATFATTIALIVPVHLRQRQVSAELNIVEEPHPVVRVPSSMQRRRTSSSRGPVAACTEPARTAWVTSRSRQRRPRHGPSTPQRRTPQPDPIPPRQREAVASLTASLVPNVSPDPPADTISRTTARGRHRNPCVDQCWQVSVLSGWCPRQALSQVERLAEPLHELKLRLDMIDVSLFVGQNHLQ